MAVRRSAPITVCLDKSPSAGVSALLQKNDLFSTASIETIRKSTWPVVFSCWPVFCYSCVSFILQQTIDITPYRVLSERQWVVNHFSTLCMRTCIWIVLVNTWWPNFQYLAKANHENKIKMHYFRKIREIRIFWTQLICLLLLQPPLVNWLRLWYVDVSSKDQLFPGIVDAENTYDLCSIKNTFETHTTMQVNV